MASPEREFDSVSPLTVTFEVLGGAAMMREGELGRRASRMGVWGSVWGGGETEGAGEGEVGEEGFWPTSWLRADFSCST